jgi:hypothetical protein
MARLLPKRAGGARERRAHHGQTSLQRSRPRLTRVAGRGQMPRNDDRAFRPSRRMATPQIVPSVSYGGLPRTRVNKGMKKDRSL